MPRNNLVRLIPNVPQQIALKHDGLAAHSGEQVRFELVDGRSLLLDLETAERLAELQVNLEEPFWICLKWTGSPEEAPYIDLWLDPAGERRRAREEAPELEERLRESITWAQGRKARKGPAIAPRPVTVQTPGKAAESELLDFEEMLLRQTNAMSDVYAKALIHAGELHGNSVKPEDVRSFVVTAFIQFMPKGWKRSAA